MSISDKHAIGQRLKRARETLGLSLEEVARKLKLGSYQTISNIEKGERAIKVSELSILSEIYYRDPWSFLSDSAANNKPAQIAWRGSRNATDYSVIERRLITISEDYCLLERINGESRTISDFAWPGSVVCKNYKDIEEKAQETIKELDLGYCPAMILCNALETKYGIRIIHYPMDEYGSAATVMTEEGVTIIINSTECAGRRNFSLAHELFHILSSNTYPLNSMAKYEEKPKGKIETLANVFASALLMPRDSIATEINKRIKRGKIQLIDLIAVAKMFAVSTEALLWRLKVLGSLDKDAVQEIAKSEQFKTIDGENRKDDRRPTEGFSPRFVYLGLNAVKSGKISKGKFCRIFELHRSRFSEFVKSQGFGEEFDYATEVKASFAEYSNHTGPDLASL